MRAILDTNVLASGFTGLARDTQGTSTLVVRAWLTGSYTLLTSDFILDELESVFKQRYFGKQLTGDQRDFVLHIVRDQAQIVTPTAKIVGIASHWQDDLVLAAAVSGNADYLVTGDAKFRRVGEYQGVKLRTPAELLRALDGQSA